MKGAVFEWSIMERKTEKHGADWYLAAGIVAFSIAATAVILGNILFAILVVISAIALFLRTLQKPREIRYALTAKGLHIADDFTPLSALESFCIDENGREPKLLVKQSSLLSPLLVIPLDGVESEVLRAHLSSLLPEAELHEPLSKRIMEFLGF